MEKQKNKNRAGVKPADDGAKKKDLKHKRRLIQAGMNEI